MGEAPSEFEINKAILERLDQRERDHLNEFAEEPPLRDLPHLGRSWRKILSNQIVWRDRSGIDHAVAELDGPYLDNLMAFLRRRARTIRLSVEVSDLNLMEDTDPVGEPQSYLVTDLAWLYEWPLWKALIAAEGRIADEQRKARVQENLDSL